MTAITYITAECQTKSKHELWRRWCSMRNVINNTRNHNYRYYGGRGIRYDPSWEDFWQFVHDVESEIGPLPYKGAFFDRLDNDGNFEPGNICWGTPRSNSNNRTTNHLVTAFGETKTLAQWCSQFNMKLSTVRCRILHYGYTPEQALTGRK